jgi:hypothetical protein
MPRISLPGSTTVQTPVIERIVKRGGDLIRMNRAAH